MPESYPGYYNAEECALYYLHSRYYDPETCRFINADAFASTGQGILGCNMFAYCNNNPVIMADPSGNVGGLLVVVITAIVFALCLSGCGSKVTSESVLSTSTPVIYPSPTPLTELSQDQKVLISTIAAEGAVDVRGNAVSSAARQAMANVALNRVGNGEWSKYSTVSEICQYTGFDGYGNANYYACMDYLDNRDGTNQMYEEIICDVLRAYESDITQGCQLYYTPAAMAPGTIPKWDFSKLVEVTIPGVDSYYEGRFFRYG